MGLHGLLQGWLYRFFVAVSINIPFYQQPYFHYLFKTCVHIAVRVRRCTFLEDRAVMASETSSVLLDCHCRMCLCGTRLCFVPNVLIIMARPVFMFMNLNRHIRGFSVLQSPLPPPPPTPSFPYGLDLPNRNVSVT
jgi:hypothetical protein